MDDLKKDERTHDREAHKKPAHQPPSSSNSVLPETSEKIRTSAWITLAILGCTLPIAFGIIRDQLPKDKLAIGVGVFSSMFAAGSVVGLAVGGSIINNFGWHATFFSIVPVAIILWVVINRFIRDNKAESETSINLGQPPSTKYSRKQPKRVSSIDLKGAIALAVTIASFLLALTYIGNSNN